MIMSKNLDSTIVDSIKEHYPVNNLDKISLLRSGPDNDIFLVSDSKNGRPRFVVRVSKRKLDPSDIVFETAWLTQLSRKGIPVPKIVPTNQGDNFYNDGRQIYTAFEYLTGDQIKISPDMKPDLAIVGEAAKTLAQIHNVSYNSDLNLIKKRNIFTEIDRILLHQDKFIQKLPQGKFFIETLSSYKNWAKDNLGNNFVLVHNDYRSNNLLFKKGKVLAVLDFDWACLGPAIKDVAHSLVEWSFPDGAQEVWQDVFDTFFDAYNQFANHPISKNADLFRWIRFVCLSDVANYIADLAEEGVYQDITYSYMYRKFLYFKNFRPYLKNL